MLPEVEVPDDVVGDIVEPLDPVRARLWRPRDDVDLFIDPDDIELPEPVPLLIEPPLEPIDPEFIEPEPVEAEPVVPDPIGDPDVPPPLVVWAKAPVARIAEAAIIIVFILISLGYCLPDLGS